MVKNLPAMLETWVPSLCWEDIENINRGIFCCLVAQSCTPLLRPHELQPTRLLCPWNFPGKGLSFPPPGDLLHPGIEPMSLKSPALAGGFFTTSATWEAPSQWVSPAKAHLQQKHGLWVWMLHQGAGVEYLLAVSSPTKPSFPWNFRVFPGDSVNF